MSRINSNIPSVIAQRVLNMQTGRLNTTLQRLSTGLRIISGKDDPAGLIASEKLRAEQRAIQAAQTNIARATNVVSVAESGLGEITNLLKDLEDLVDRSSNTAGLSDEERAANQLEIDGILSSIDRIASSNELQGKKLLGGALAYTTSTVSAANIAYLQLNSVRVPRGGKRAVSINVTTAASQAIVSYTGGAVGATPVTIEVTGNLGTERLTLASASVANIASAIAQSRDLTGVSADVASTTVRIRSTAYGSSQFVKVRVLSGTFTMDGSGTDYGNDVKANVNGQTITGDGLKLTTRTSVFDANITLASAFGSVTTGGTTRFAVTGGGGDFTIAPKLDLHSLASLGITAINTTLLGDTDSGYLYTLGTGQTNSVTTGNFFTAQRIVRNALDQVGSLRGRLGSFEKNTLTTSANSLKIQYENVSAAESSIRDADFAEETSNLTRGQILVQSATLVLRLANQAPQSVLSLLQ
jgi:flagellin